MKWNFLFFLNSILLGIGLAMDSFSVAVADAIAYPKTKKSKMIIMSIIFGVIHFLMTTIGWLCVTKIKDKFVKFEPFIPYISLALLLFIGIEMLVEAIKNKKKEEEKEIKPLTWPNIIIQGIATALDALSLGFAFAEYDVFQCIVSNGIIALMTGSITFLGLILGKIVGKKFSTFSSVLGSVILIGIGIEIFIRGVFF